MFAALIRTFAGLSLVIATPALAQSGPADPDTKAWWALTGELSGDAMEGRDTGTPAYDRAAAVVAAKFKAAGLRPLGENGSWYQPVKLRQVQIDRATITAGPRKLTFLHDITFDIGDAMPARIDAPLAYRGYCAADALGDVRGKIVICHGTSRPDKPSAAGRMKAVRDAGGAGMLTIADPGFTVEPPRWPFAYARTVKPADAPIDPDRFIRGRVNADTLTWLLGRSGADLATRGAAGKDLPSFDTGERLTARLTISRKAIVSSNVIGLLPGIDPALSDQAIVLSAHLDGYGHGEPVNGDGLYNGTLDDAAYVALLIRLAELRGGKGFRRPVIFAAWTGEEKGLLGSAAYVAHPTWPQARTAANINLDQLRPIFPLQLLTVHALDDTTLGDDARAVAEAMHVAVQSDPEPERNLLRRSDQWNFLAAGIPATAFVFGYRPGSPSERVYRQWYKTGYHKPQDDLAQPIDWQAAADFNRFFYGLVARVADQDAAPAWKPGSKLRPTK